MDHPPYLPRDTAKLDPVQALRRLVTANAVAFNGRLTADEIAKSWWGKDLRQLELIAKAAVQPTSTTSAGGLVAAEMGPFIRSLRHRSAAAALMSVAPMASLSRIGAVALPMAASGFPDAVFVAEGGAIPAVQGTFGTAIVGPPSKLALIAGLSEELSAYSAENAEVIVGEAMEDAATRSLDAGLFSTAAASSSRPAGLLNGVSPITATSGGGITAMTKDLQNLVAGIVAAGGGSSIVIFANPVQAVAINVLAANGAGYPVIPAPSLSVGTIVAVEAAAFASGFSGLPEVSVGREPVIHYENSAPAQIATAGTPNVVAAPVRSVWQTNTLALRLILPTAWAMRGSGLVQVINGATW
jgi:HK97 family phage major capsid protein